MDKCECYHEVRKKHYLFHPLTGHPIGFIKVVGVCWGTKEQDECSCGGDESKCDFYPHIRERGKSDV